LFFSSFTLGGAAGSILSCLFIFSLAFRSDSDDWGRVLTLPPLLTAIQAQYEQSHRLIC
jgi:hypothetical protein